MAKKLRRSENTDMHQLLLSGICRIYKPELIRRKISLFAI